MTTITLHREDLDVLATMLRHARCVAAQETDADVGFVRLSTAESLTVRGFAREDVGQPGVRVFIITDRGRAAAETVRDSEHSEGGTDGSQRGTEGP